MRVKLTITGDFVVTPDFVNSELFSNEIVSLFEKSELNVTNLECPILDENTIYDKIRKTGPHIFSNKEIVTHLKKLNMNLVTMANNHIMDFGSNGLENTIKTLKKNRIDFVGSGRTLNEAKKFKVKSFGDVKIAFINFCENEWSIASKDGSGACPLDLIVNYSQIKQAKENSDFVIVIVHGGHEYYSLPSPRMVKQYRFFTEIGADIVVSHHSHCISGFESWNNKPIFYGLGNMIFTVPNEKEEFYKGIVLELEISSNKLVEWNIIPFKQSKKDFYVRLLQGCEKEKVLKKIEQYSQIIQNESLLLNHWQSFAQRQNYLLNSFSPISLIRWKKLKGAFNRIGLNNLFLTDIFLSRILNQIRCEAHFDVTKELINQRLIKGDENSHS